MEQLMSLLTYEEINELIEMKLHPPSDPSHIDVWVTQWGYKQTPDKIIPYHIDHENKTRKLMELLSDNEVNKFIKLFTELKKSTGFLNLLRPKNNIPKPKPIPAEFNIDEIDDNLIEVVKPKIKVSNLFKPSIKAVLDFHRIIEKMLIGYDNVTSHYIVFKEILEANGTYRLIELPFNIRTVNRLKFKFEDELKQITKLVIENDTFYQNLLVRTRPLYRIASVSNITEEELNDVLELLKEYPSLQIRVK